jgi:uncharacterized protein with HEPN domain
VDIGVAKRLHDAHRACLKLMALTRNLDLAAFRNEETVPLASERLLGIVGEALAVALKTDPSLDRAVPDTRRAIGLRNRIIHGYDEVSDATIWDTIETNIPELVVNLKHLLEETTLP